MQRDAGTAGGRRGRRPPHGHPVAVVAVVAAALVARAAPALAQTPAGVDSLAADVARRRAIAEALVAAGRQRDAIVEYEELARRAPADVTALRRLAQLYTWNSLPRKAVMIYERVVALDSADLETRRLLAQQYVWAERPLDGIRQLEAIVARKPDDTAARRLLAQQYVAQQMTDRAIEQYRAILTRDSADVGAATLLAQQLVWHDRPRDAVPILERVVALAPDSVAVRLTLARALSATGRSADARGHLARVVRAEPTNAAALLLLAELERWSGRWDLARRRLRKVLALEPTNARAAELLSGIGREYGPLADGSVVRTTDSNGLTIEEIPVRADVRADRHWELGASVARRRVRNDRLAAAVAGVEAGGVVQYNFLPGGSIQLGLASSSYSSGWSPVSGRLQLSQRFADRYYTTVRYGRVESREGVGALQQRIMTDRAEAEVYVQATDRLSVSAALQRVNYSDVNTRVTGAGFASYRVRLARPGLTLYVSDAYEDTRRVYPRATPYWTPDHLRTATSRLVVDQQVLGALRLRVGGGVALQQRVLSSTYALHLDLLHMGRQTLVADFERLGSEVYAQRRMQARYSYRF
jgi:tetratricopeptide (TPR) repeat protein